MEIDTWNTARNAVLFAVLDKLLDGTPRLDDRELDVLYGHLSRINAETNASFLAAERHRTTAWIARAAAHFSTGHAHPPHLLSFATDVTAHACSDEETFSSLTFNTTFETIIKLLTAQIRRHATNNTHSSKKLQISYVKILKRILVHTSGLQWTISTKFWSEVVILATRIGDDDNEVFSDCCDYLACLIEGTKRMNRMFCARILKSLFAQLGTDTHCGRAAVLRILQGTLEAIWRMRVSPDELFYITAQIDDWSDFLTSLRSNSDSNHRFAIDKTRLLLAFFELYNLTRLTNEEEFKFKAITPGRKILGCIVDTGTSGQYLRMYELCNLSYSYWCCIRDLDGLYEFSADNVRIMFETQIVTFQTMPIYYIETQKMGLKPEFWDLLDDLRQDYFTKFMKGLHPLTYQYLPIWINYLMSNVTYDMAISSIRSIKVSKSLYDSEYLSFLSRCFIYLLEDLVSWCVEFSGNCVEEVPEEYVVALLEKNREMCDEFGLTWRENVETIKVTGIVFDVLQVSAWSARVVIKSLELLNVAVSNYMSPGMALLIDNARDSDVSRFGPMLFPKLRSDCEDVRIAALNVVKTTAALAREKFVSYRKVIVDADFPRTVLKMALDECAVRARSAALECLAEMIGVEEFCADLLDEKVYFRLIDSLRRPADAALIAPLCALFTAIYSRDPELPPSVFYAMLDPLAAVSRLSAHALSFWRALIDSRLRDRGMIDGSFPAYTFSIRSKKIVSLDDGAIGETLANLIDELNRLGCLSVFYEAVSATGREVALAAVELLRDLSKLLNDYDVRAHLARMRIDGVTVASSNSPNRKMMDPMDFLDVVLDLDGFMERKHGEVDGIYDVIRKILGPEAAPDVTNAATAQPEEELTYMLLD